MFWLFIWDIFWVVNRWFIYLLVLIIFLLVIVDFLLYRQHWTSVNCCSYNRYKCKTIVIRFSSLPPLFLSLFSRIKGERTRFIDLDDQIRCDYLVYSLKFSYSLLKVLTVTNFSIPFSESIVIPLHDECFIILKLPRVNQQGLFIFKAHYMWSHKEDSLVNVLVKLLFKGDSHDRLQV